MTNTCRKRQGLYLSALDFKFLDFLQFRNEAEFRNSANVKT